MRDLAIVEHLQRMIDIKIAWLAPDPAGSFLRSKGCDVLKCSAQLAGSGKAYQQAFRQCINEFNLMDYVRLDAKLHRHDFDISRQAWNSATYDVIVGDEAFWLLGGFGSQRSKKPAPFIFLTDFIGVKAMKFRVRDLYAAWYRNFQFTMSYLAPDIYLYIGNVEEIPSERFGLFLPNRRKWAQQHCRFVKPIVNFDPERFPEKKILRKKLDLPEDTQIFLSVIGPEGNFAYRMEQIALAFQCLKRDFPEAYFCMIAPEIGQNAWIHYHRYLANLPEYFGASDCVITQSGYGKTIELSALGIPFIAIPLDYHFEQEYVMAHRLKHYGAGKLLILRHSAPEDIAREVKAFMKQQVEKVPVDRGAEVANIILETIGKRPEEICI